MPVIDTEWVGATLHKDEVKTIEAIADKKRWKRSMVIAEMIRESPTFVKEHKPVGTKGKRKPS